MALLRAALESRYADPAHELLFYEIRKYHLGYLHAMQDRENQLLGVTSGLMARLDILEASAKTP